MIFIVLMLLSNLSLYCAHQPKRSVSAPPRILKHQDSSSCFANATFKPRKHGEITRSLTELTTPTDCITATTGERSPLTPIFPTEPAQPPRFEPIHQTKTARPPINAWQEKPHIRFPDGYAVTVAELKQLVTGQLQLLYEPRIIINGQTLGISAYEWICVGFLLTDGTKKPLTKLDL